MNNERRKRLHYVKQKLEDCVDELSGLKEEEDEVRDNIPENLENSTMFINSEESSDRISDAIDNVEEAIKEIEEIPD